MTDEKRKQIRAFVAFISPMSYRHYDLVNLTNILVKVFDSYQARKGPNEDQTDNKENSRNH